MKIPSIDMAFSMAEVFAFSCLLLYGPEMAVATLAIDVLLLSRKLRHTAAQTIFNFGNLTVCVWISGDHLLRGGRRGTALSKPTLSGWCSSRLV